MNRSLRSALRALAVVWALPTTLVGFLLTGVAILTGGHASLVNGVIEAHGGWIGRALERLPVGRGGAAAVTLGHVVIANDRTALALTRSHERAHVSQCERWGPFFLPAYALASLWALLRGADPYRDNVFERKAFAVSDPTQEGSTPMASRGEGPQST